MDTPQQQNAASTALDWFTSRPWGLASRNFLIGLGFVVIVFGAVVDIAQFVENRGADESSTIAQPSTQPSAPVINDSEVMEAPTEAVPAGLVPIPDEFLDLLANTYTVVAGDVLYEIALRHGTTPRVLIDLNDIVDPNRIEVGQVLALPETVPSR